MYLKFPAAEYFQMGVIIVGFVFFCKEKKSKKTFFPRKAERNPWLICFYSNSRLGEVSFGLSRFCIYRAVSIEIKNGFG